MRIVMVNAYAHVTGGADRNCLALSDELGKRGHQVAFLATESPANVAGEGDFIRARVTHASRDQLPFRKQIDVAWRALWNPDAARTMKRLIDGFRPDVVHTHKLYPQLSVAPVVVAARAGLPVVQTLHDYDLLSASQLDHTGGRVDRDESKLSYRALNTATYPIRRRVLAPRVSAWIACSRFLAARYRARGIAATAVLPYFVETVEGPSPAFGDRAGVLFVGRLHAEKGVLDVIRLAESLPETKVRVLGYGPLEETVRTAALRLENLEFLGRSDRSGVLQMARGARVLVMPSRWQEPSGIAALEAMSVGTPVVAYANGGLAESVKDAGGGRVIRADPSELARATSEIHESESVWRALSERAISGVARTHTAESYVPRVEEIYRRIATA